MTRWEQAQRWELNWWGDCANTYGEEMKQLLYADRMGLWRFHNGKSPYNFDLGGKFVLDIGGGPCSLLLKCINVRGKVVDPILHHVPDWVTARYAQCAIWIDARAGEDMCVVKNEWDEAGIYNVLQHVRDPQTVVTNALWAANLVRLFEWIDTPVNEGHLHTLTEHSLNEWLGGEGCVERFSGEANCHGVAYYGVFERKS
jgi:hypothetical protein